MRIAVAAAAALALLARASTQLPPLPAPGASPTPRPLATTQRAESSAPRAETSALQLAGLPRVTRVLVDAARDRVMLIEEINLPRGEWNRDGLDLYVAFGAPGPPIAIDARLFAASSGAPGVRSEDSGDPVALELPKVRRGSGVSLLLGKAQMAGALLRVKDVQLRRAFAGEGVARLRIRSLLRPPATEPGGARDLVVRLGIHGGLPMTLDRIQVRSLEPGAPITRAEAKLCGPEADPWPLAVEGVPAVPTAATSAAPTAANTVLPPAIAPSMAVRHDSDDLCVRWWTAR